MTKKPKRPKLTLDLIVDSAIELIEAEGLESLSTRALGQRLGVQAMSLYHHIGSKDALLDMVTARLALMIEFTDDASGWREELETVSRSYIDIARRYPRSFPLLAARRFNTPETLPVLERILSIFRRTGLPASSVASSFRIMGYYLSGAGLTEGATREAERRTDFYLNDTDFLKGFPISQETLPYFALPNLATIFEKGLAMILDAIEEEVERARRDRPTPSDGDQAAAEDDISKPISLPRRSTP